MKANKPPSKLTKSSGPAYKVALKLSISKLNFSLTVSSSEGCLAVNIQNLYD